MTKEPITIAMNNAAALYDFLSESDKETLHYVAYLRARIWRRLEEAHSGIVDEHGDRARSNELLLDLIDLAHDEILAAEDDEQGD